MKSKLEGITIFFQTLQSKWNLLERTDAVIQTDQRIVFHNTRRQISTEVLRSKEKMVIKESSSQTSWEAQDKQVQVNGALALNLNNDKSHYIKSSSETTFVTKIIARERLQMNSKI